MSILKINNVSVNLGDAQEDVTQFAHPTSEFDDRPSNALGYQMVMPVKFKLPSDTEWWILPVEPLVGLSGGNVIAKRNVAKGSGRGTIKERWGQDDYAISIEGILINYDNANEYPLSDVEQLRKFCEARTAIDIQCPLLDAFNINHFCIEKYDIPFTKGSENQKYSLNGYSDDLFSLLVEDVKPMSTVL